MQKNYGIFAHRLAVAWANGFS